MKLANKKVAYYLRPSIQDLRTATKDELDFAYGYAYGVLTGLMYAGLVNSTKEYFKLSDLINNLYYRLKEKEEEIA